MTGKADKRPCLAAAKAIKSAHLSHKLFRGWLDDSEAGVPLTFCMRCGCYASTNTVKLKQQCAGGKANSHKATILNRLGQNKHPISQVKVRDVQRIKSVFSEVKLLVSQICCTPEQDEELGGACFSPESPSRAGASRTAASTEGWDAEAMAQQDSSSDVGEVDEVWLREQGF